MELKVYNDVDKIFTSGQFSITRQDFESMPCVMMAELCDDETMQNIVKGIDYFMTTDFKPIELRKFHLFRIGEEDKLTRNEIITCERISCVEFEYMEKLALHYGMRYWEDLTEEEQDYLIKNYNF